MRSVAVQRWSKVEVAAPVAGDAPAVSESVPLAGCPPVTTRLLNHLVVPAYSNVPEPVCEELEDDFDRGGRIEGQQRGMARSYGGSSAAARRPGREM